MTIKPLYVVLIALLIIGLLISSGLLFKSNGEYEAQVEIHKANAEKWEKSSKANADTARVYKDSANKTFNEGIELTNTEVIKIEYVEVRTDIRHANMAEFDSLLSDILSTDGSN